MSTTDEVIRLVLQTQGQESIENLRKSTENYRSVLEDVTVQFAKGEITAEEYERKLRKVGKEYENQTALLRRFEAETAGSMGGAGAAVDKVGEKTDAAKGRTAAFGRTAIETGRVVQDFYQGGFAGVLNNIEGLFASLGKAVGLSAATVSGLAGAATIAGVALYAFGPQIKEAVKGLGLFGEESSKAVDVLAKLKERIEALEEKGIEIGVDVTQLESARREVERIEKALGAAERLRNRQGDWEKEAGKQVGDVLAEDPDTLARARSRLLEEAAASDGKIAEARAQSERARERLAEMDRQARERGGIENVGTEFEAGPRVEYDYLRNQVDAMAREAAARRAELDRRGGVVDQVLDPLVQAAQEGRGEAQGRARGQLAGLLERSGQGDVAGRVRAATPEAIEREDAEQEAFDAAITRRQEAVERRDEKRKRQDEQDAGRYDAEAERFQAELDARKEAVERRDAELERREGESPAQRAERALADRFAAEPGVTKGEAEALAKRSSQLRAADVSPETADRQARDELKAADDPERFEEVRQRGDDLVKSARSFDQPRAVSPDQLYEQDLADQVQGRTGWSAGASEGAAKRMVELQEQGFDAMASWNEALSEQQAALAQNWQVLQSLQAQVEMVRRQGQQTYREMAARQRSYLNRGY